jgi:hypothetical protein
VQVDELARKNQDLEKKLKESKMHSNAQNQFKRPMSASGPQTKMASTMSKPLPSKKGTIMSPGKDSDMKNLVAEMSRTLKTQNAEISRLKEGGGGEDHAMFQLKKHSSDMVDKTKKLHEREQE